MNETHYLETDGAFAREEQPTERAPEAGLAPEKQRPTMTRAELADEVARAAELTQKDARVVVETVIQTIVQALQRGERIELRGFGSLAVRHRGPRRGRNPKTGAPVDVPAQRVPYFKPGQTLKEMINQ